MINIFYVEVKNENGEYEPLGVMKLEQALAWCWETRSLHSRFIHCPR